MVWEIKLFVVISEILLYDLKEYEETGGKIDEETGEVGCQYVNITIDIPKIEKTEDIEILLRQVQDKLYDKPVNANI